MPTTITSRAATTLIASTSATTAAPTGGTNGFMLEAGYSGRVNSVVRTFIDYTGTVSACTLRLYTRSSTGAWFRSLSSTDIVALTGTDEVRDWPVGEASEFYFTVEAITGGGTVVVSGMAVSGSMSGTSSPSSGGSGSAGTEYTEGAVDATITGPAFMWEDAADTLRAVSAAKPLPTNPGVVLLNDTVAIKVKGNTAIVRIAYTVQSTPDYSELDVLGGKITLTNIIRETGEGLVLNSLTVTQIDGLTPELRFFFYDADLTGGTYTENSAFAESAADSANFLGEVLVKSGLKTAGGTGDWVTGGGNTKATVKGIGLPLQADSTKTLYMMCVAGSIINFTTTTGMQVVLGCLRD